MLVCHAWRALGTPFLYEHLSLPRLRRLDAVLQSLELPFTISGEEGPATLGHLVKILDITLPSEDRREWSNSRSSVMTLLKRTPNASILRLDWQSIKGILEPATMADTCWHDGVLHNLECIDISQTFESPVLSLASDFIAFLDRHQQLRRLDLVFILLLNDIGQPVQTPALRPAIRELDFSPSELVKTSAVFPSGTFPNLEKAVVLAQPPNTIGNFAECLRAHGKPLKSISLAYSSTMAKTRVAPAGTLMWQDMQAVLRAMAESCPALEEISFSGTDLTPIPSQPVDGHMSLTITTVTTLGIEIEVYKRQFSKKVCVEFLEQALSWTRRKHLPNLRTIRFLSESNVRYMRRSHSKRLEKFIGKCAAAGVQVQDSFRVPLHTGPSDSAEK